MQRILRPGLLGLVSIAFLAPTAATREFEMKNSALGRRIHDFLNGLASRVGNRSSASLDSLAVDTSKAEIRIRATLRMGHSWGTFRVPKLPFGTREVDVAADRSIGIAFSYSMSTGKMAGRASIPIGELRVSALGKSFRQDLGTLTIDLAALERLMDGDWVELFEYIPNPGGVVEREFDNEWKRIRDSYHDRYGRDNVYFASPRFVAWASPERAGRWVVEGIVSGGANSEKIFKQVEKQARLELADIKGWLEKKGLRAAQETALALVTGQRVSWPYMALKWQTVLYRSRIHVAGRPVTPWIPSRHAAFVLIWKSDLAGPDRPPPAGPRTLGVGKFRTGELTASDRKDSQGRRFHLYDAQLQGGRRYRIDVIGSGLDTFVYVNFNGSTIGSDDDSGGNRNARLTLQPRVTGTYRIAVAGFGGAVGKYRVELREMASTTRPSPPDDPRPDPPGNNSPDVASIGVGASRSGVLDTADAVSDQGKHFDIYLADLVGGQRFVVDLTSQEFDTYLLVYQGDRKIDFNDDHEGSRRHSRVTFTAPTSGRYRIVVTSFGKKETGRYGLALGRLAAPPPTVSNPPPNNPPGLNPPRPRPSQVERLERRGVLARGDAVNPRTKKFYDVHVFTFQAGRTYTIELTSSAFDAYLVLQDTQGRTLDQNDDAFGRHSRIVFRPTRSGSFRVIATSLSPGRTGAYTVFLRSEPR